MATTDTERADEAVPEMVLPGTSYYPDTFCPSCQTVIDRIHNLLQIEQHEISRDDFHEEEHVLHNHYSTLLRSAANGCHLCSIVVGTTWLHGRGQVTEASDRMRKWFEKSSDGVIKLTFRAPIHSTIRTGVLGMVHSFGPADARLSVGCELGGGGMIHVVPKRLCAGPSRLPPMPRSSFTGDRDILKLALWWLSKCKTQHGAACSTAIDTPADERPARLLYVSSTVPLRLQVRAVQHQGSLPVYTALSYCWGADSSRSTRLLSDNLEDFKSRIHLDALPKTIQDAVRVTRALGCKYLWVDSICIVQDSDADWHAEAKKMGSIYRNALLTIAALACSTNSQSLFRHRNPLSERPCTVRSQTSDSGHVVSSVAHFFNREVEIYRPATAPPLHRRAWVVQERFSAVRTLFFGETGVFWECSELVASDADQEGLHERDEHNQKLMSSRALTKPGYIETDDEVAPFLHVWNLIREQYTLCELTYESDRLNAVLGIMNLIAQRRGWDHYNGMWLDILALDMCWHCSQPSRRRMDNDSPSWSWASLKGTISGLLDLDEYLLRPRSTVIADIVAYPAGCPITVQGVPSRIAAALQGRPASVLSFFAPLRKAFFTHKAGKLCNTLAFVEPTNDAGIASLTQTIPDSKKEFTWLPDLPLDTSETVGWIMNLVEYEDLKKYGIIALVLVNVDWPKRMYQRVGIMKRKTYRSPEQVEFRRSGERDTILLNGQRPLPYNELAEETYLLSLVHLK